jgi:hypothetical protein
VRKAAIDANLLVLLAVGTLDPSLIPRHKRTDTFATEDFDTLLTYLGQFGVLETTPHCLAEAGNHLSQIGEPIRRNLRTTLQALLASTFEVYVPSSSAVLAGCYLDLGLADATLAELVRNGRTLVTTDLDLYLWVLRQGHQAINFNHVRTGAWS